MKTINFIRYNTIEDFFVNFVWAKYLNSKPRKKIFKKRHYLAQTKFTSNINPLLY